MGFDTIPEYCPTCDILRTEDETYKGNPTEMDMDNLLCYDISNMCLHCFKFVNNNREFGESTKQIEEEIYHVTSERTKEKSQ